MRARLIDRRGTLCVLVSATEGDASPPDVGRRSPIGLEVHGSRPDDVAGLAARALLQGRTVAVFDERGVTPHTVDRIAHIGAVLAEYARRATAIDWTCAAVADAEIEGEEAAIEWFVRSATDLLIAGSLVFEKRARS